MAKENVKKFFEEVSKSEDLQERLKAATEKQEAEIAKAVKAQAEVVAELAKSEGFDFSADELLAAETETKKLALFDRGLKRKAFCNAQKPTLLKLPLEDLEELEKNTPDNAALPPPLPKPEVDDKEKTAVLSDEEKKIAAKMGLTDEQFAEIKKHCQNQENE